MMKEVTVAHLHDAVVDPRHHHDEVMEILFPS